MKQISGFHYNKYKNYLNKQHIRNNNTFIYTELFQFHTIFVSSFSFSTYISIEVNKNKYIIYGVLESDNTLFILPR